MLAGVFPLAVLFKTGNSLKVFCYACGYFMDIQDAYQKGGNIEIM